MAEKVKILLVDDDVDFSDLNKAVLENHGFEVAVAFSGQEGLEKGRFEQPDLIRRIGRTLRGERLHRPPGGFVLDPPQPPHQRRLSALRSRLSAHSAIFTHGWAVISRYSASSCAFEVARTTQVTDR